MITPNYSVDYNNCFNRYRRAHNIRSWTWWYFNLPTLILAIPSHYVDTNAHLQAHTKTPHRFTHTQCTQKHRVGTYTHKSHVNLHVFTHRRTTQAGKHHKHTHTLTLTHTQKFHANTKWNKHTHTLTETPHG